MYIEPTEINTHMNDGQIMSISEGDLTKLHTAIQAAITEVRGYLADRYDIDAEFAKTADDRNSLLVLYVKDIAVWHFVNLANVNTSLELRAKRRDDAIKVLESVHKGNFNMLLPQLEDENKQAVITYHSNEKRENHY